MGLFHRRDKESPAAPQAPRGGGESSEQVQFLIPRGVTWTTNDIFALEARGAYAEALEKWRVLLVPYEDPKFAAQIRSMPAHRVIWLHIGLCSRHLERFDDAIQAYGKAETLAREAGDKSLLLQVLNALGVVHRHRGDIDASLTCLERALSEAKAEGEAGTLAGIHDNMAHCHLLRGDLQRALREAEAAYAEFASSPSRVHGSVQSRVLGNLGMIHRELGNREQAMEFLQRALSKAREVGDRAQEALILENLSTMSGSGRS